MRVVLKMADPAGNRTAIVRSEVPKEKRAALAGRIMAMAELDAEQVGYECPPQDPRSLGRLEMMGGEFCGNAARSFGFLRCLEEGRSAGQIELSGTDGPLAVHCSAAEGTAWTQMPIPREIFIWDGQRELHGETAAGLLAAGPSLFGPGTGRYPVVVSRGITHLIALDQEKDEELVRQMIARFGQCYDAFGVQFLKEEEMTPAVYVRGTNSLFYESSCGSGSLAVAWCLSAIEGTLDGDNLYTFREPGGTMVVSVSERECAIGGPVTLEETLEIEI